MQENDYQERCRDELEISQLDQEQTHDLSMRELKSAPPLDDKTFSILESKLKYCLAVPQRLPGAVN